MSLIYPDCFGHNFFSLLFNNKKRDDTQPLTWKWSFFQVERMGKLRHLENISKVLFGDQERVVAHEKDIGCWCITSWQGFGFIGVVRTQLVVGRECVFMYRYNCNCQGRMGCSREGVWRQRFVKKGRVVKTVNFIIQF